MSSHTEPVTAMTTQAPQLRTSGSQVDVLVQHSTLDWRYPSGNEVAVTGGFISAHGGQIHHGLGGRSQLDIETRRYGPFRPYLDLEAALRFYIPNLLGLQLSESSHDCAWDSLSEEISHMERQFKTAKKGLWYSLWHKMGQSQEAAEAWMAFIPDEYGLGVVKAGLALVFKLAEASADKRQRIYDTFAALRDTLIHAHPERRSFRTNQSLNECVDELYQSVVDAIHDIAVWLASENKSPWDKVASRFKRRHDAALTSPEKVLKKLEEQTEKFREALNLARDRAIEDTEIMSRATGLRTVMVHREMLATHQDVLATKQNTEQIKTNIETCTTTVERVGARVIEGVDMFGSNIRDDMSHLSADMGRLNTKMDEQYRELQVLVAAGLGQLAQASAEAAEGKVRIAMRERGIQQRQETNRTKLLEIVLQKKQEMEARIAMLETQLFQAQSRRSVLDFPTLCDILAPGPSHGPHRATHFDVVFKQPAKDLANAVAEEGGPNCPIRDQSQVQSLLTRHEFTSWLNLSSHALLYVDAALEKAANQPLSAASLLTAKLVAAVPAVFGHTAIVLHFFCGLHVSDEWCGPEGMMRSLIVQLLMRLVDLDPETEWRGLEFARDKDFPNIDRFAWALEAEDLYALRTAFRALLRDLPDRMTVFVVLDSVLFLDRLLASWNFVLESLTELMEAQELPVFVKVLMINQRRKSQKVRMLPVVQSWGSKKLIELNDTCGSGEGMWGRRVEDQLRRTSGQKVPARGRDREEADYDDYAEDERHYDCNYDGLCSE